MEIGERMKHVETMKVNSSHSTHIIAAELPMSRKKIKWKSNNCL